MLTRQLDAFAVQRGWDATRNLYGPTGERQKTIVRTGTWTVGSGIYYTVNDVIYYYLSSHRHRLTFRIGKYISDAKRWLLTTEIVKSGP